jgi:biopolymer transport protein TolR
MPSPVGKGKRLMGEINVVPYIDVMLVLLIIFMITAPLMTQGVKVELPKAGAQPLDPKMLQNDKPLVLSIDREGQLYLNRGSQQEQGKALSDGDVMARAREEIAKNAELPVLLKGDTAVRYGRVVEAMVLLQRAGVKKVGFITDPPPVRQRK